MRKKALGRVCLLFLFATLLFPLLALSTMAQEESDPYSSLPPEYEDLLDAIPEELVPLLPDGVFSQNAEEVGNALGRMSDLSYLLSTLLEVAGLKIKECLGLLCSVAGLLILSAVCKALKTAFPSAGIEQAFSFCSALVLLLGLLDKTGASLEGIASYFAGLRGFASASVPLLGTLYAMGGNVSAAAASSAGLSAYLAVLENLVGGSILPFCGICMALALVSSLDPSIRMGTLLATLKKNYTTLLAFLMMLLLAMLGAQTALGAHSDTLAMRSVKFAAGNLIPVVGGSVGELLKTVSASVGYLRGTVGICGILLLLFFLLPTVVELFLLRLTWQLAASLADLLGCDTEKKLLEEFASLLGFLIAAAAICSSVLILAFALLSRCASAIG